MKSFVICNNLDGIGSSCLVKEVREGQTPRCHLPVESKKIKMKDCNKTERLMDIENKLVVTRGDGGEGRGMIGVGIKSTNYCLQNK